MEIGEVTAAAAGNEDLLADARSAFEHGNAASALASLDGAHKAGGASAEDDDVEVVGHVSLVLAFLTSVALRVDVNVAAGTETRDSRGSSDASCGRRFP